MIMYPQGARSKILKVSKMSHYSMQQLNTMTEVTLVSMTMEKEMMTDGMMVGMVVNMMMVEIMMMEVSKVTF